MILTNSEDFFGKIVKIVLVENSISDYIVGKLNAVEKNGVLVSDTEHYEDDNRVERERDINYFIPRDKIIYIKYQPDEDY